MRKHFRFAIVILLMLCPSLKAQTPVPATPDAPSPAARESDPLTKAERGAALKIQFIVSKYQGEKRISSIPYVITTNANQPHGTSLRMGARIPVPVTVTPAGAAPSFQFENIGTS